MSNPIHTFTTKDVRITENGIEDIPPIHTPGPLSLLYAARSISIVRHGFVETIARCEIESTRPMEETGANARLLAATYNAFDSAAAKLGVNAVELAERMQDGGITALVEAVKAAKEMSDWFMEHSRQAEHAHEELKQPLHETAGWKELVDAGYNGRMASYHGQFEEALAKVKAGAS